MILAEGEVVVDWLWWGEWETAKSAVQYVALYENR